jgi:Zn-dependent metalloprotease
MKRLPLLLLAVVAAQLSAASEPRPNLTAWQRFVREHGNAWAVEWNPVTGTPHRISGSFLPIQGVTKNTVEKAARSFIARYSDLLGVDPASLELTKAEFDPPEKDRRGHGTWYVAFRQVYHHIPVQGGSVRLIIRSNRVTSFGSDFFPGIDVQAKPVVPLDRAIDLARRDLNLNKGSTPVKTRLIVFPDIRTSTIRYHLAWEIVMPVVHRPDIRRDSVVPQQWRYLIDAISGEIVDRKNVMRDATLSGRVSGTVRMSPTDPPVTVDFPTVSVTVKQGTSTSTRETDASGTYSFSALTSGSATVAAQLSNPFIIVHNVETADPDTTHSATVTASSTHDWNFSADDPSPNDVEENAYYFVEKMRQWFLRGAPFNVTPDPSLTDVYVRDGPYCNASAGFGNLRFGSGAGGCTDMALCSDIIQHEYTHIIADRLYLDAGVYGNTSECFAMNEAWADYYPASMGNDPTMGVGCFPPGRNIETPNHRFPDDVIGESHEDGLIFSGALWDLRSALGATYVDALALRAEKHAPVSFTEYVSGLLEEDDDPSFNPSPAADGNLANGTPNINAICHSYYDLHGILDGNCTGHTQTPIAMITAPSPVSLNSIPASAPSVVVTGSALGSSQPFQSFTIDYASEDAPATFLTAGVTLAGGGSSPVNHASLGTLNTATLAEGFYKVRLTVTDTSGASAVAMTNVLIYRALMPGWPQSTNTDFSAAPAIADLDRAFPGLEIFALDVGGTLRAWHHDGTSLPGFPRYLGGGWLPAVAAGDLDGDGSLEIVAVNDADGYVWAFHGNGTVVTGWPKLTYIWTMSPSPTLSDLDGDGKLEVIVVFETGVFAWHDNGVPVTGWPIAVYGGIRSSVAVADLDGDGKREVIAGSRDGNIYVWRADGTLFSGWPVNVTGQASAGPAVGDLDGDGALEIVVGAYDDSTATSRVHAFHHTGVPLTGWPKTVAGVFKGPSSVVLADLDRDGHLEVIGQTRDNTIHIWHGDGTIAAGWPRPGSGRLEPLPSSPVVGDIDGDGDADLIAEGPDTRLPGVFVDHLYAFHANGTPVAGWPKVINMVDASSPALADVDGDGNVDVVIGARGVFVWKLNGMFTTGPGDWQAFRHDQLRTGSMINGGPQQPVIDFNAASNLAIGGPSQQKLAQTMTFEWGGDLTEVAFPVGCSAGSDLLLNIEGVSAGRPNGIVQWSQVIPQSAVADLSPPYFRTLVLSTPLHVNPGDRYAIVLSSAGSCGILTGPVGDPYSGGKLYFDSRPNAAGVWVCVCDFAGSAFDLPFLTNVRP